MATWQCIKGCGACCNLDPSDRPDLADYLSPEELIHYFSLVGKEGWCINFDQQSRDCRIYDERPRFCRVLPEIFEQMFEVSPEDFNDFAIDCCEQQIEGVYGEDSPELERYDEAIA